MAEKTVKVLVGPVRATSATVKTDDVGWTARWSTACSADAQWTAPLTRSQTTTPFLAPVPTRYRPSWPTNSTRDSADLGDLMNSEHESVPRSSLVRGSQRVTTVP